MKPSLQEQIEWMQRRDGLNHRYRGMHSPYEREMDEAILASLRALRHVEIMHSAEMTTLRAAVMEIIGILCEPHEHGAVYQVHDKALEAAREILKLTATVSDEDGPA